MEQLLAWGQPVGSTQTRSDNTRITQERLREALLVSSSEYDFVCRASLLIAPPNQESRIYPLLHGVNPTLKNWNQKEYIAIVFSSPSIKSPVSTFGHISIVATNSPIGDLEPDAVVLEFTATEEMSPSNIAKGLFSNIRGSFGLRWFVEKQIEYDQKDRDIWSYTVNSLIQTPHGLLEDLGSIIDKPMEYNIVDKNCSERLYQLMTTRNIVDSRFNRISVPLDDLKDLASAGWFVNRHKILSTASKADVFDFQSKKLQQVRLGLHSALLSDNPIVVEAKRNEALFLAQQILQENPSGFTTARPSTEKPAGDPTYFKRGPSILIGGGVGDPGRTNRSEALRFEFKVGAFDFLNADQYSFGSSELSFLSVGSTYTEGRLQLDKLTIFKLDATEVSTLSKPGLTRWLYLGWENLLPFAPRGSSPSEGLISFGGGRTIALDDSGTLQASLRAIAAVGYSKGSQILKPTASFTVFGGGILDIKVNSGAFPRFRYSLEWRPLERNSIYRTRQEFNIVPTEINKVSIFVNYKIYDNKYKEFEFGFSVPLNLMK